MRGTGKLSGSLGGFSSSFFSSLAVMIFVNSVYVFYSKQISV